MIPLKAITELKKFTGGRFELAVEIEGSTTRLIATDGFCIMIYEDKEGIEGIDGKYVVDEQILNSIKTDCVVISLGNEIFFNSIHADLIETEFPDWKTAISQGNTLGDNLIDAVKLELVVMSALQFAPYVTVTPSAPGSAIVIKSENVTHALMHMGS